MRNSAIARLVVMAGLAIMLLKPLTWVWATVAERASRRDQAVTEVSNLRRPSDHRGTIDHSIYRGLDRQRRTAAARTERALPSRDIKFRQPSIRRRASEDLRRRRLPPSSGGERFADRNDVDPAGAKHQWQNATISVGVSDPRGLTRKVALQFAGRETPFSGGAADVGVFQTGIQAKIAQPESLQQIAELPFAFTLELNGTRDIRFLPAADETTVDLTAGWPHPSFVGSPLPEQRRNDDSGFSARWHAPDFARPYAARWTSGEMNREQLQAQAHASAFGVSLIQPVDIYHQAERAVKYAALFIVLTFLVFFLWEVLHTALLHPMHYAFVGFALFVFYLLLVSISEHAGFDKAYLVSAVVTTLVIGGYARAVLQGRRQGASVVAALSSLYGFLYLLLRLEDYALLAGSIGLFIVLAGVMYLTRRMDWYSLRLGTKPPE
jgi:inner membrane protein